MKYEDTICQYVFLGKPNNKGWRQTLCRVCNDHGRKGLRAGWRFDDQSVAYHCFNCEIKGGFHVGSVDMPSDDFKLILRAFNVPDEFVSELEMQVITNRTNGSGVKDNILKSIVHQAPKVVQLPQDFVRVDSLDIAHPMRMLIEIHLEDARSMTLNQYPLYTCISPKDPKYKKWNKRLIIPIFDAYNNLIYYQGRDMVGTSASKYLSCDTDRTNVVYGLSEIAARSNAPLFITEGFFDAFHVKGVATLGRQLTQSMVDVLDKCPREKIIIPDRYGDGQDLALSGIRRGWKVATPDIGQCKDVTEAIVKYGKLYVFKNIMDNIHSGIAAETMVNMYCK